MYKGNLKVGDYILFVPSGGCEWACDRRFSEGELLKIYSYDADPKTKIPFSVRRFNGKNERWICEKCCDLQVTTDIVEEYLAEQKE